MLMLEPPHDKTNKMACATIRLGGSEPSKCAQWVAEDPMFLHVYSEDSDQTGRTVRWVHRPLCWFCHKAALL